MNKPKNKKHQEKDFTPSNLRIGMHVIIGAILGAPIGAMVVSCIASIIGSVGGFFSGLSDSISEGTFWGFLVASIDNIGNGAAELACEWTSYGAKFGPWVFAVLAFFLSTTKWEDEEDEKKESTPENPN